MIRTFTKQLLSTTLSVLLLIGTTPFEAGAQTGQSGYSGQGVPLTADELQQLVAPIALYPDALVAQVLAAATFPDQIAAAESWLSVPQLSDRLNPDAAVDAQPWDPAIKALTQFPSVLSNMASNLTWTSSLGEAYHTQSGDVMTAIQVLRAKAYAAGNLKSSTQLSVVQQSPQVIVIQPVNPQVVYVPMYNPAVVYGYPYVVPAYVYVPPPAGAAVVAFGVGIAVGAMMAGGSYAWGYSSWNCGWHGTHGSGLSRRRILRKQRMAWRLLRLQCIRVWCLRRQRPRVKWLQPLHRHLRAWRHSLKRLRQRKCRSSVQPKDRGLCLDCARVQCVWQLWGLDRFEKWHHR